MAGILMHLQHFPSDADKQSLKQITEDKFRGGGNLLFNLKNGGMDVGKINPAVPQEFIDKMNELKQKIIDGKVKVPATL
jgi:basic membrane protein A